MTPARPVRHFGDSAVVIDVTSVEEAHAVAASIDGTASAGLEDVIVGYRSVTVVADPTVTDLTRLAETLASLASLAPGVARLSAGKLVEIPVNLDGSDLDEVARLAGMSPRRVVDLLTGADLQVAFVGFAPGFAYLVGLDPDLAAVPRRPTPRPAVPAGSVALAGGFAGIYPQTSPGGWHLVGRTGTRLFDPGTAPYSVLQAGDVVRLRLAEAAGDADVGELGRTSPSAARPPLRSDAGRTMVVEDPGLLTFVQDGGRLGVARLGVPRAGAADPFALRTANRLVGNHERAAALEATARGPALRFSASVHVAVVGAATVRLDGRGVPTDAVVPVAAGQTVSMGTLHQGLRAYIAVSGGIDIPPVIGSRSSDVLCGLGAGPLVGGDALGLGPPGRPRGRSLRTPLSGAAAPLRVMAGPDTFPPSTVERLLSTIWEVDPTSNRIGVRLRAESPLEILGAGIDSRGMVSGAIQLPPDGQPIVLLCDHATVGGYPVIATVVSADLGLLGQLRPGDAVRFHRVDLVEAVRARAEREREISDGVVGWYPVRTD
jgi:KipI family sensor histidine kinase inhibitor